MHFRPDDFFAELLSAAFASESAAGMALFGFMDDTIRYVGWLMRFYSV